MIEFEPSVIDRLVEERRPDVLTTDFWAGWNDHRAGVPRGRRFAGRVLLDDYLAGWDARHRLAVAAASEMLR